MSKSTKLKLYPLFRQASNLSTATNIDISNDSASDGDNDEDDLPLTCLLMRSKPKNPPTRKSRSEPSKPKKGKKRFASAVTVDTRIAENKDPCSTECKKRKQKKNMCEPAIQSNGRTTSISITSNAIANVTPDSSASIAKDASFNESECNGNWSYDAETIVSNYEDKGFSPTSRNSTHGNDDVNQQRIGRLYSDTAMDFVGPYKSQPESDQPHGPKIRNVVHKLNRRIANGGCLSQHPRNRHYSPFSKARIIQNKLSSISSSYCWPNKWKIPSWISLEQPSMRNDTRDIDHIKWDPMGVLLAVAIDKTIIIYDWDMFRAADLQGRSDRARNCQESEFKIPPIVIFRLPHPVASLVWNPFEMDELAVGFR
jgi:hypothetical protein